MSRRVPRALITTGVVLFVLYVGAFAMTCGTVAKLRASYMDIPVLLLLSPALWFGCLMGAGSPATAFSTVNFTACLAMSLFGTLFLFVCGVALYWTLHNTVMDAVDTYITLRRIAEPRKRQQ